MRSHLAKYWEGIRSSYWFVPTIMTIAVVLLSVITTALDAHWADAWPLGNGWLALNTASGARALLATIAGSMITVAGVTFSITIAAVAYATSQLGPRLLSNFMRDTSNQVTLGTFIATFVYGLLILRTVRGGDGANSDDFIPHVGLLVALILAMASLGVLIYFIHHIPRSIQASEVIAQLGNELEQKIGSLFLSRLGESPPESADLQAAARAYPVSSGQPVTARSTGYLTHLDGQGLHKLACTEQLVLRLVRQPGDFITAGETLAIVYGDVSDAQCRQVRLAFALGRERTQAQDLRFVLQQLVEIAARALSPGVNDPFTAISCLDWLGGALVSLGNRTMPSGFRYDSNGQLRIIAPALSFAEVVEEMMDQLRPYAAGDRNVALHTLEVIERVVCNVPHPPHGETLLEHATALLRHAEHDLSQQRDLASLKAVHDRIERRVRAAAPPPATGA